MARQRIHPAHVVVADPPWLMGDKLPGPGRGAAKHYKVMTAKQIAAMELPPVADDAILFLWRLSAMVDEAMMVARAWGFAPKAEIVWVKLSKSAAYSEMNALKLHFGMGRYVRAAHETCIIAVRGKGRELLRERNHRSVFFAPVGEHSEKPEVFFQRVERMYPGPYVELFARRRRAGWQQYGDEVGVLP